MSREVAELGNLEITENNLDELLERSGELFDRIDSSTPQLADKAEPYFVAAALRIKFLAALGRYDDIISFMSRIGGPLDELDRFGLDDSTLSTMSASLSRTAFVLSETGERRSALRCLTQASKLLARCDDVSARVALEVATSNVYVLFGTPAAHRIATERSLEAVRLSRENELWIPLLNSLCNLVFCLSAEKKFRDAVTRGLELLGVLDQAADRPEVDGFYVTTARVVAHTNIATAWLGLGDIDRGEAHLNTAMVINERHGPDFRIGIAHLRMAGRLLEAKERPDEAVEPARRALEAAEAAQHIETVKGCYAELSRYYEAAGDLQQALVCERMFRQIEQKLLDENAAASFENLMVHADLESSLALNERLVEVNRGERRRNEVLANQIDDLAMVADIVSHDTRSPLLAIGVSAELIKTARPTTDQAQFHAENILESVQSVQAMIDDLMLWSTTAGALAQSFQVVDLKHVVADAVASHDGKIERLGAEVIVGPLPSVVGAELLLTAMFRNLISNALKYQPSDEPGHVPKIEVSAQPIDRGWAVCVRDNGIGVPVSFAEEVFEPFRRLSGDDVDGVGLGMAICRRVMTMHGGEISLEGSAGEGSCFELRFPPRSEVASLDGLGAS